MPNQFGQKVTTLLRQAARAEDKPITLLFFVAGVLLTLFQYRDYVETTRVDKSYQHIEDWEEDGYKKAFDAISADIRADFNLAFSSAALADTPADARAVPAANFVRKQLKKLEPEKQQDLNQVLYYFDKLYVCVDRDLCDGPLLEQFFGGSLPRFWTFAEAYVTQKRTAESIPDFARLTQKYAELLKQREAD